MFNGTPRRVPFRRGYQKMEGKSKEKLTEDLPMAALKGMALLPFDKSR